MLETLHANLDLLRAVKRGEESMQTHHYYYLSKSKIDMLYEQNHTEHNKEIIKEFGAAALGFSGKISSKEASDLNYYAKLQFIEEEFERNNLTGKITTPEKQFINDFMKLDWSMNKGLTIWRGWYYDSSNRVFYRLLMYGSTSNIEPYYLTDETGIRGSCFKEVLAILDTAIKENLDESLEINEYVDDEMKCEDIKERVEDYRLDVNEKWQIIESIFTTQDMGYIHGDNRLQKVLARVDYRETITREYYLKNFINRFNIIEEPTRMLNSRRRYAELGLGVPKDAEYIVYIYASPITVEYQDYSMDVHTINNKEYLYISDSTMKKIRKEYPSQPDLVEFLAALLTENGMRGSGHMLKDTYYRAYRSNHWNYLPDDQLFSLINQHITNIARL